MNLNCPLCGKPKPQNVLFCDDCHNKMEHQYEINISANKDAVNNEELVEKDDDKLNQHPIAEKKPIYEDDKSRGNNEERGGDKKRTKITKVSFGIILLAGLFVAFVLFNHFVLKNNLEKSWWDKTLNENSVESYLAYMVKFPKGKNYHEAEKNLMDIKHNQNVAWEELRKSENSAALQDYITSYPGSPYEVLVKRKIDSLSWQASLKDNTRESYSKYILQANNGDYEGEFLVRAQKRRDLLTQVYPANSSERDSIVLVMDAFFNALSAVDAGKLNTLLSDRVFQFLDIKRSGSKEKIVGELLISGSKTHSPTIIFKPDLNSLVYEKTSIEHIKVNVPVQKTSTHQDGSTQTVAGFIFHFEMDSDFRILLLSETTPFDD